MDTLQPQKLPNVILEPSPEKKNNNLKAAENQLHVEIHLESHCFGNETRKYGNLNGH